MPIGCFKTPTGRVLTKEEQKKKREMEQIKRLEKIAADKRASDARRIKIRDLQREIKT